MKNLLYVYKAYYGEKWLYECYWGDIDLGVLVRVSSLERMAKLILDDMKLRRYVKSGITFVLPYELSFNYDHCPGHRAPVDITPKIGCCVELSLEEKKEFTAQMLTASQQS